MNIGRHASGALILMLLTTLASQVAADERVQEFAYDDAGRLQKVISPEREVTYTLDDAGNRTSLASEQREIGDRFIFFAHSFNDLSLSLIEGGGFAK